MAIDAMCLLQIQLYYYKRQSVDCQSLTALANEHALRELGLWNLNSTPNSPVAPRRPCCQIFANHREAETSENENKRLTTRAQGNGVITNVMSANRLFRCRYSNSRDVVASSPSFSRLAARALLRACSQAKTAPTLWDLKVT